MSRRWEVASPDLARCYFCGKKGFYNSRARLREMDQQLESEPPKLRVVDAGEIPEAAIDQRFFVCTSVLGWELRLKWLARHNPSIMTECERLAVVRATLES